MYQLKNGENEKEDLVKLAIEKYNKYHSPEATAKMIKLSKKQFSVEFSGPYCKTCGIILQDN